MIAWVSTYVYACLIVHIYVLVVYASVRMCAYSMRTVNVYLHICGISYVAVGTIPSYHYASMQKLPSDGRSIFIRSAVYCQT